MANETKFDGQYGGLGIASSIADSGDTAFTASPATVTAVFPLVGGQQPQVSRGKAYVEVKGLNAAAVLGAIVLTVSDGTNSEIVASIAGPAATAGRGGSFVVEWFTARALVTNVVSMAATIVTTTNNNGTGRLRVLGGP